MNIEQEEENKSNEFEETGGKIIESYPDGRPKRWLCGKGENGEIIDPPDKERESIRYLNAEGKWEAGNPDKELLEEFDRWRGN